MTILGSSGLTGADFGKGFRQGTKEDYGQVGSGGLGRGRKARELYPLALDVDFHRETFAGALDTNIWTAAQVGGGSNFALRTNDPAGSLVRGTTGAVAGNGVELNGARQFLGDLNCGLQIAFRTDTVSPFKFEMGFVDVQTSKATLNDSAIGVPTFGNGVGDLVQIAMDTTQALTTMAFEGLNSDGAVAWTSGWTLGSVAQTPKPTVSQWMICRIQLEGDAAHAFIWDNTGAPVAEAHRAVAIEGGTVLFPFAQFFTTGAAVNVDLDLFHRWQDEAQ